MCISCKFVFIVHSSGPKLKCWDSPKGNKNEKVNIITIFIHIHYNDKIHLCKNNNTARQKLVGFNLNIEHILDAKVLVTKILAATSTFSLVAEGS